MFEDVLFSQEGPLGLMTLNRPAALNALTLPMILAIQQQLERWKDDDSIAAVVVCAVPGSAFCAGGDIRWLYQVGREHPKEQKQFFWHEYRLNHYIHHFGKPYIALMDGLTMGGGVGISLHGSHPVASEHFVFAMPETGIGFFPDIGASHLLSRCSGGLGIYLGLTGNRLGPKDALHVGLVKKIVASKQMPHFISALAKEDLSKNAHQRVDQVVQRYAFNEFSEPSSMKPLMERCFIQPTVEMIRVALQESEGVWAEGVDNRLRQKSPLSLKVTLAQLQKAKGLSLAECLEMDFNLVQHFMRGKDFYEGVRALLIDKDKNPKWNPQHLDLISEEMVSQYFEASGDALRFIACGGE